MIKIIDIKDDKMYYPLPKYGIFSDHYITDEEKKLIERKLKIKKIKSKL